MEIHAGCSPTGRSKDQSKKLSDFAGSLCWLVRTVDRLRHPPEFSPPRAKLLAQPDLADYFGAELKTLPPTLAHLPLFEKIRASIKKLQPILGKSPEALTRADIGLIRMEASGLNEAIRRGE